MTQSRKQINFYLHNDPDDQSANSIDKLIANIKQYSQDHGDLLEKYDENFYLNYFDRNTIQQVSIKLGGQEQHKKELKLEEFIRRFLSFIEHKHEETLFLAMSLRTLFIKIKEQTNNEVGLKFADFTNYLCDRIAKDDPDLIAPLKQVPQQKIHPDVSRIREIDINPPLVLKNDTQSDLPRIAKTKKKKDKKLAQRKPVSKFIYNFQTNQIITIGRLSSCIHFYDSELKKQTTQITPKTYLDISRQIAILSMDFDETNQRIGVIINGMGILFWQASDNFQTQKTITKYFGQKIFYLKLFKEWVTTDKNTIYFWNLNDETVSRKIVNEQSVMVNDICEVNHLRCVCVSYTELDGRKPFIVYKNNKPIARYDMGSTGCHSLHYNIPSQMIIAAGYHNTMEVFEVENRTFSINLKKQLKGHSSIVTCISDIRNTNFILSGDDSGEIRIWQLNFMKCIQVVKVSKYINQVYCTGQKLIFSDSRLNVMQMDKFSLPYTDDDQIIYQFFEQQTSSQYTVTRKCFRKINFYTGRVEMVFVVCDEDEEISSTIKISAGIIIGTSKGHLKLYTVEGREKWNVPAHEGEITAIKYDRKTRFIFCVGSDNKLTIWPEKSLLIDGAKKTVTFKNKIFNIMALLTEVRILFLASSQQNQICVWDYENLRLLTVIRLNSPVIFMEVNTLYRMLLVSTINDELCFFKLLWKNGYLDYEMIYNGDSIFSGLKKAKTVNYCSSMNKQGALGDQNAQQNLMAQTKKKKSTKKLMSKVSITPENDNLISEEVFVTTNKISHAQDKAMKKSAFKMTASYDADHIQEVEGNKMPVPSIRLIKEEFTHPVAQQTEQMLGTLKSLKKIDNQIATRIQIKNTEQSVFLIMGNSKGQITCFDISQLIKQHFADYETQFKQSESPNIYRPAREDYQQEILKQKHSTLTLQSIKKIPKTKKNHFRLVWKQACRTRQPISCLSFVEMKHIYLGASMTDGCCKYVDLSTGTVRGDLKLNLPLPIYWDVQIQKDLYIKKNIYQTLIVLDSIISNQGFEMLSKEYQAINVTKFLESLKKNKFTKKPISKSHIAKPETQRKVTLLKQQYSIEDVKNIIHGATDTTNTESTLKSLEAHKRVNLIKQQMNLEQMNSDQLSQVNESTKLPNELLRQKEELQKLFASNYFSVIGEHGVANKLNKSVELGSIEQRSTLLLERINQTKRNMTNQHIVKKPVSKRLKRQASLVPSLPSIQTPLIESMLYGKEDNCKEGNLVQKLSHSLTLKPNFLKQKNSIQTPSALPTCSLIGAILKKNASSISVVTSKISKMPYSRTAEGSMEKENKYEKRNLPGLDRSSIVEDKSAKDILMQINQKLSKYKKSNYAKRDII